MDCRHLCRSRGFMNGAGQVTNDHDCSEGNATYIWKCIPTTTTNLKLSNSMIEEIPHGIFADLSSLQILDLSDNMVKQLVPGVFADLSSLQFL
ncbi:negative regulation of STAT cascade [Porites harrisoni]